MFRRKIVEEVVTNNCPAADEMSFSSLSIIGMAMGGIIILVVVLLNLILLPKRREQTKTLQKELLKHAVITGGSSGIGLSIAKDLVGRKCEKVTLIARNVQKLEEAKNFLTEYASSIESSTLIEIVSVDVSDIEKIKDAAKNICTAENGTSIVTMLFNVAGTSTSAAFVDTDHEEFERLMNINYLGSAYVTRSFLPYMKSELNAPRSIIFTSSQAGQLGVYGLTAYSASKFALRGLAEALHMEVARDNIHVHIAYPPDTDTPGFELENIDKPEETKLISETSGLFQPDSVAKSIVSSALNRRPPFMIYFGLEGWMLATLTAGMCPVQTNINALCQIFLMSPLRLISLFYLMDFRRIIYNVKKSASTTEN